MSTTATLSRAIPLLDLHAQYKSIAAQLEAAVLEVLRSQQYILGPKVEECEAQVARFCDCDNAVGVSSGTDALLMCLMAEGIGPGDEVITTPYTFFATVGCISRLGATPVFVDICPDTYNLAVAQVEDRITRNTKAIIPVHLFGQCADMDPLVALAKRSGLVVIEDAAQAIGAQYQGRSAGSMGDYGCFSFFPSKNLGCAGDGGMVVTNDPVRAEKLRVLRVHGSNPKYYHPVIGGNFRLDALQAAIVTTKLRHLDAWNESRRENARRYRELFGEAGLCEPGLVEPPGEYSIGRHIYNQFVIRVRRRDELRDHLKGQAIGSEVYYPVPAHLQQCLAHLGYGKGEFPESERAANETLAIPVYPELTPEQQLTVVQSIAAFYGK